MTVASLGGVITNTAIFALAALFEIAGCFAFWMWLRRGTTPLIALLGIASLIACIIPPGARDGSMLGLPFGPNRAKKQSVWHVTTLDARALLRSKIAQTVQRVPRARRGSRDFAARGSSCARGPAAPKH